MMLFTDIWGKGNILREYSVTGSGEHRAGERRLSRGLQAPRPMTCCGSETPSGLRTSASSRSLQLRVGLRGFHLKAGQRLLTLDGVGLGAPRFSVPFQKETRWSRIACFNSSQTREKKMGLIFLR